MQMTLGTADLQSAEYGTIQGNSLGPKHHCVGRHDMLRIRSFQLEPLSTLIFTPLAFTMIIDRPNHGRHDRSSTQTIKPTIEGSSRTLTSPL
jgi:hypothetical protein